MSHAERVPEDFPEQDEISTLIEILDQRQRLHQPTQEILDRLKSLSQGDAKRLIASRFVLKEEIFNDGQIRRFKAWDNKLEQPVMIVFWNRMLRNSLKFIESAKKIAPLKSQNILHVFESFPENPQPFYVTELPEGEMFEPFGKHSALTQTEKLKILLKIGQVLTIFYDAGLVHNDVRPTNIFISADGQVKLTGFDYVQEEGIAQFPYATLSNLKYYPPERQEKGTIEHRSDIYSLAACVVYSIVDSRMGSFFPPRPLEAIDQLNFPQSAKDVLATALAEDPSERYDTVEAFCKALDSSFRLEAQIPEPIYPLKYKADVLEFLEEVPWSKALMERGKQDDLYLTHWQYDEEAKRRLLQIRLPESLRDAFGLASEVLILATEDPVTGRDVRAAKDALLLREFELDRDLLIIMDGHPHLEKRVDDIYPHWGQWIPWPLQKGQFPPLEHCFRAHAFNHDIFEQRDPVRGLQAIGRANAVTNLIRYIKQGKSAGVYGLRKIGKTTTVLAAVDKLSPPGERSRAVLPVAKLDCSRVYDPTLSSLIPMLCKEVRAAVTNFTPDELEERTEESLGDMDHLLKAILGFLDTPLCLVLDEYDLLFDDASGQGGIPNIDRFFSMLRGHAQETGLLSLILIGRDPSYLNHPLMNGRTNPMLGWSIDFWLGPMDRTDADMLLDRLGKRVRLAMGPKTLETAYAYTGGHPLLHRQFGSVLLNLTSDDLQNQNHAPTDGHLEQALRDFRERDAVRTICQEVKALLGYRYPKALALLKNLAQSDASALSEAANETDRDPWLILTRFGLIVENREQTFIPQIFRWYFQQPANT